MKKWAYYNDSDRKVCAWVRELIKAGQITDGEVDERSICDVQPADVASFRRVHFFCGIAGWELALRKAGWPDSRPVWTASLPCQPFSAAGNQRGTDDERHLWPVFIELVRSRRPEWMFGEQVENAVRLGWLDGVFGDLEAEGYACGAAVLGAHSVGAPHIRQRLYWMAKSQGKGRTGVESECAGGICERARARSDCSTVGLAHADGGHAGTERIQRSGEHRQRAEDGGDGERLANTDEPGCAELRQRTGERALGEGCYSGDWSDYYLIQCRDGKTRRVKSGLFPLAPRVPGRVGLLRGYGNAIVPAVAALFIQAAQEAMTP